MSTIKAKATGGTITLKNGKNSVYLGKGKDVVRTGANNGNHVIYGYDSSKDIIEINKGIKYYDGLLGYSMVGNDVILRLGKTKLTLKNMLNKTVRFRFQGNRDIEPLTPHKEMTNEVRNVSYAKKGSSYDWTKVVANKNFSGDFDMDEYNENLRIFDARAAKHRVVVKGGDNNDVIYASNYGSVIWGDDGNDTIYCGNGSDTIFYNNDDNNDTIVNFNAKQDKVLIGEDCGYIKGTTVDGKDLVVTIGQNKWHANHGNATLRFKGGAAMSGLKLREGDVDEGHVIVSQKKNGHFRNFAQSVSYNSKTKTLTALTTNVGGNYNLASYASNAIKLDASKLKVKATLTGNAQGNTIIAGQAGGDIKAGKGSDKITCGAGSDRIWFGKGDGKDTVLKSGKNDVAYLYGIKDINKVSKKLTNGVMTLGIKGASDTLSISGWKNGSSLATVQLANGKKYSFTSTGGFKAK